MDTMEKMDPHSHEWGYIGRRFPGLQVVGTDGGRSVHRGPPQVTAGYPPSQGADTLSLKKALEKAQDLMERPNRAAN
jgi:arylsulfatase